MSIGLIYSGFKLGAADQRPRRTPGDAWGVDRLVSLASRRGHASAVRSSSRSFSFRATISASLARDSSFLTDEPAPPSRSPSHRKTLSRRTSGCECNRDLPACVEHTGFREWPRPRQYRPGNTSTPTDFCAILEFYDKP